MGSWFGGWSSSGKQRWSTRSTAPFVVHRGASGVEGDWVIITSPSPHLGHHLVHGQALKLSSPLVVWLRKSAQPEFR